MKTKPVVVLFSLTFAVTLALGQDGNPLTPFGWVPDTEENLKTLDDLMSEANKTTQQALPSSVLGGLKNFLSFIPFFPWDDELQADLHARRHVADTADFLGDCIEENFDPALQSDALKLIDQIIASALLAPESTPRPDSGSDTCSVEIQPRDPQNERRGLIYNDDGSRRISVVAVADEPPGIFTWSVAEDPSGICCSSPFPPPSTGDLPELEDSKTFRLLSERAIRENAKDQGRADPPVWGDIIVKVVFTSMDTERTCEDKRLLIFDAERSKPR